MAVLDEFIEKTSDSLISGEDGEASEVDNLPSRSHITAYQNDEDENPLVRKQVPESLSLEKQSLSKIT